MIEILRLSLPISVWLIGFSAVYALQGLTCSRHWPSSIDAVYALLTAWAIAIALQIFSLMVIAYKPSHSRFVQTTAIAIAITALVATVWTMMPVLAVTNCF